MTVSKDDDEEESGEVEREKEKAKSGLVLSFLKGSREKSPLRNEPAAVKKCDIQSVKYTPRMDRDSVEEAGWLM
jgi:hypothetical protein